MSAAWIIARAYLQVAMGWRAPQDIPASHPLLVATFLAYFALTVALARVAEPWETALRAASVDALVLPAFGGAVLWLRGQGARWLQTVTALAGVGALFTAASIPAFALVQQLGDSPMAGLASMAVLALFAWNLFADAHIFRHALSLPYPAGIAVALAYAAASIAAVDFLVPEAAA